jgi:hypothetical protein
MSDPLFEEMTRAAGIPDALPASAGHELPDSPQADPLAADTGPEKRPDRDPPPIDGQLGLFVDWPAFWARDRSEPDWLLEGILARARGHSIFAPHKVGKSLLMLWCAGELVAQGVLVLYLDFEMGEEDLYERLDDMGQGPESDLSLLRYALLPNLPPLDTPAGARTLMRIVDAELAAHPGVHLAVVIDTIGRATVGEENSNDTIQNFYRHTGLGLKQRRCTWARLDHAGWDPSKGARGASAKGDDVDVVWRLVPIEGGVELRRVAARMGWVPEKVSLQLREEPLRFDPVPLSWPAGTETTAAMLDHLGVPLETSIRAAQAALRAEGEGRRRQVVNAALNWRRQGPKRAGTAPGTAP